MSPPPIRRLHALVAVAVISMAVIPPAAAQSTGACLESRTGLVPDSHIRSFAQAWAETLALSGSIAHTSADSRMDHLGAKWGDSVLGSGEVVAMVSDSDDPCGAVWSAWQGSPDHRNILGDPAYTHVGGGMAFSPAGGTWHAVVVVASIAGATAPTTTTTTTATTETTVTTTAATTTTTRTTATTTAPVAGTAPPSTTAPLSPSSTSPGTSGTSEPPTDTGGPDGEEPPTAAQDAAVGVIGMLAPLARLVMRACGVFGLAVDLASVTDALHRTVVLDRAADGSPVVLLSGRVIWPTPSR